MDILLPIIGNMFSLASFAMIAMGVMKLFQVAADIKEAKEILKDIRRNTEQGTGGEPGKSQSPAALIRSVNAASKPAAYAPPAAEPNLRSLDADAYAAALHAQVAQDLHRAPALQAEIVPAREHLR